jgi:hypothetical protein
VSVFAKFSFAAVGNTIPYPPCHDGNRTNEGFVDLRNRPDLVESIHEARSSPALGNLLRQVATSKHWVTLGCDAGERTDCPRGEVGYRAGGYVQLTSSDLNTDYDYYKQVAEDLHQELEGPSDGYDWWISYEVGDVCYKLLEEETEIASLWVWFEAGGKTTEIARDSREALLLTLSRTLIGRAS